jgi:hypothetical protein
MYFTIGAIFKNEAHILKEWIDHYLYHGVEHIYLINDCSTDQFLHIIQPYINKKLVTLYHSDNKEKYLGIQEDKYNFYFQRHLKETTWFGIVDLDEFLYSPLVIDIKVILKKYERFNLLQINWVHFGSSHFEQQPNNVVSNFVHRSSYTNINANGRYNSYKSIVKTNGNVQLGIHTHKYNNTYPCKNVSFSEKNTPLLINHYAIQSKEFWQTIKMTRGDADFYVDTQKWERDLQLFNDLDINTIFDERLKIQNSKITT